MITYTNTTMELMQTNDQRLLPIIATAPVFTQLDKNGMPVMKMNFDEQTDISKNEFILIKGVVRDPKKNCAEMFHMLEDGRVVALQEGRGSSFEHMKDESVLFHALIPKQTSSEYKEVLLKGKEWLRKAFAGWHHIYHEVFASAHVIAIQPL